MDCRAMLQMISTYKCIRYRIRITRCVIKNFNLYLGNLRSGCCIFCIFYNQRCKTVTFRLTKTSKVKSFSVGISFESKERTITVGFFVWIHACMILYSPQKKWGLKFSMITLLSHSFRREFTGHRPKIFSFSFRK